MPEWSLELCVGTMDGLKSIKPHPDSTFFVTLSCGQCGEHSEKKIGVHVNTQVDVPGSRSTCSLLWTCKFCKRPSNVTVVENSMGSYSPDDVGSFKSMVVFNCRGCDVASYEVREEFVAELPSGRARDVQLENSEWVDYDSEAGESLSLLELETRIERKR